MHKRQRAQGKMWFRTPVQVVAVGIQQVTRCNWPAQAPEDEEKALLGWPVDGLPRPECRGAMVGGLAMLDSGPDWPAAVA